MNSVFPVIIYYYIGNNIPVGKEWHVDKINNTKLSMEVKYSTSNTWIQTDGLKNFFDTKISQTKIRAITNP